MTFTRSVSSSTLATVMSTVRLARSGISSTNMEPPFRGIYATCVVNWEEDLVLGQRARTDAPSIRLFARAKGATAGCFPSPTILELIDFVLHYGVTGDLTAGKACTHARFLEADFRGIRGCTSTTRGLS